MIHAISSDNPLFHNVEFKPGMNVILADRTALSSDKDSRNGLGKTTLVDIVNFCLGGDPSNTLKSSVVEGWKFYLTLDLMGDVHTICVDTSEPRRIFFEKEVERTEWIIKPSLNEETGKYELPKAVWNKLLGSLMFGLPQFDKSEKNVVTFRSLISYFIRRGRIAYDDPFEHHKAQTEWDKQVNNAFLLGLGWEYAQKLQHLKDRESDLKDLLRIANAGTVPNLLGKLGELEASRVRYGERTSEIRKQLDSFQVHPQYYEIISRADELTVAIHENSNENVHDTKLVRLYEDDILAEKPADASAVTELYTQAGAILPELVQRRLEEVQEFHRQISENRKNFLRTEVTRIQKDIQSRRDLIRSFSDERAQLMEIINTHGALDERIKLEERYAATVAKLESVEQQINILKSVERGRSTLKIEREQLLIDARADHEERKRITQQAISIFNSNSEALYDSPGTLSMYFDENGFRFKIDIERDMSEGIKQVGKVFTYDLTLAQIWANKLIKPGFLIHDSAIFDGVDERQVAKALELAARRSSENGFQYICLLNTDQIPLADFSSDFNLDEYVRLRLTDDTPEGGLLGVRF